MTPEGWLNTMLINQRNGLTGYLDTIIFPFTQGGWGENPFVRNYKGIQSGFWVPYEQTAYYYDGAIRCGYLLNDSFLINKAQKAVYNTIKNASPEGILEPILSQGDRRRWPHSVFFRAMMAQYEATNDEKIINAMEKHFLNDTIPLAGRDLCNVEAMAWVYMHTENKDIYNKLMLWKDSQGKSSFQEDDLGDYGSPERQEIHAVTYHEVLKLPIIYYMLTGDKRELEKARMGFAKLDRYHMLPDGVASGEEGTSGKGSQNTHETCNIVDYIWTLSYMLKATGETEWADKMERALFNAGMGAITKNFDAHQYLSCPNQVYCGDYSSHVSSYNVSRLAYRQMHKPPCCTGNVNRMFPAFVGNMWLTGEKNSLYKALYGPGKMEHTVNGKKIVLQEQSVYPYSDTITISIVSGSAEFPLYLRIPGWCNNPQLFVNGKERNDIKPGTFFCLNRVFEAGDKIVLVAPKQAEFINWDGYEAMVVNYGPLLFALPVKAKITKEIVSLGGEFENKPFIGYTMSPQTDWNYILGVDGTDNSLIKVVKHPIKDINNPWIQSQQPIELRVPMYKDPTWTSHYQKVITDSGDEVFAPLTPPLPARGAMIFVLRKLNPEIKSLVPYGSTYLRMSMFPFWKETEISPEVLAAE